MNDATIPSAPVADPIPPDVHTHLRAQRREVPRVKSLAAEMAAELKECRACGRTYDREQFRALGPVEWNFTPQLRVLLAECRCESHITMRMEGAPWF